MREENSGGKSSFEQSRTEGKIRESSGKEILRLVERSSSELVMTSLFTASEL
jgi:hypothetical protein